MKIGECWDLVLTLACHLTEEQKIVQHIVPFLINVFLGERVLPFFRVKGNKVKC